MESTFRNKPRAILLGAGTLCLFIFSFAPQFANAASYYVRADGGITDCANKASSTSATATTTSMNLTGLAGCTAGNAFADGDIVYLSSRGGDFTTQMTVPSGGSSPSTPVYYQGEPGFEPTFEGGGILATGIRIAGISNIEMSDITVQNMTTNSLYSTGVSEGLVFRRLVLTDSGDQNFNFWDDTEATIYDSTTTNAFDDGISMHNDARANVYNTYFGSNGTAVQAIHTAGVNVYNSTIDGGATGSGLSPGVQPAVIDGNLIIVAPSAGKSGLILGAADHTITNNVFIIEGSTSAIGINQWVGATSSISTVNNNVFYSSSGGSFGAGIQLRGTSATSTITGSNNTFYGLFRGTYQFDTDDVLTLDHSSYYNVGTKHGGNTTNLTETNVLAGDPDPLFVNPGTDFTLQATSPLIDAGVDINLALDAVGNPRYDMPGVTNTGSAGSYTKNYVDIGAYEYSLPPDLSIVSPTHPSEAATYGSNSPVTISFSSPYDQVATTTDFRYLVNQTASTSVTIADVKAGALLDDAITVDVGGSISSNGTWYVHAVAQNEASTTIFSTNFDSYTINYDGTSPMFSSISAGVSTSTATITWTTDEITSTQLAYGLTTAYTATTTETDTSPRVTSHSVSLSNLALCTTYHYQVSGTDGASNQSFGTDQTFTTTGCEGGVTPIANNSADIATTTGGVVTLSDLTLTVPSGATNDDAVFQIQEITNGDISGAIGTPLGVNGGTGNYFELTAYSDASTTISTFNSPVTLTLSYTNAQVEDLEESSLAIYRWNGSSWSVLSGCTVNTGANTVTCTTTQFSVFGIFGDESSSSGSSATRPNVRTKPAEVAVDEPPMEPTTIPTYTFTAYLEIGSQSQEVSQLQEALRKTGHFTYPEITGYFGPVTETAVRAFQADHGIEQLGIVGPQTRAALNSIKVTPDTHRAQLLQQIAELQQLIATLTIQLDARLEMEGG